MEQIHPSRVLVIDDSAFSRQAIRRILESSPLIEVVGVARDGEEALRKAIELKPDLITLDLEMPRMDGFTFLRLVMSKRPTPVVVVSGRAGQEDVFKALELGAVDFIAKPSARAMPELHSIEEGLIRKVHAIRGMRIEMVSKRIQAPPPVLSEEISSTEAVRATGRAPVVVLGASTGGPAALMRIFGAFTEAPPCAFFVSLHMPPVFTRSFAERLDRLTPLRVREAVSGRPAEPGTVLVAPGGHHLEFQSTGSNIETRVRPSLGKDRYTPSVDRLFESAAKAFGEHLLAVVLTGMGDDGRAGARRVREAGGGVLAESESTAVIYGMPKQVIDAGLVDEVLPLEEIPGAIQRGLVEISSPRPVAVQGQ